MKKPETKLESLTLDQLATITGGGLVWHPGEGFPRGYRKPPRSRNGNRPR
jgi:hypothetical protein